MIKTPYKMQLSEYYDHHNEIEKDLQKIYRGFRLIRESKDISTNLWVYRVWFENEKDYTWFELKQQ
jgi:hypothetical protein